MKVFQHSLTELLAEADGLSPSLQLSKYSAIMARFASYYRNRYPDNNVPLAKMSSEEIFELDEFIISLNDNLPLPFDARYRSGLYALVTFSLHGRAIPPWEIWIRQHNLALAPRWAQIAEDFRSVLRNLYPDNFA
jgi:hypothetical protein